MESVEEVERYLNLEGEGDGEGGETGWPVDATTAMASRTTLATSSLDLLDPAAYAHHGHVDHWGAASSGWKEQEVGGRDDMEDALGLDSPRDLATTTGVWVDPASLDVSRLAHGIDTASAWGAMPVSPIVTESTTSKGGESEYRFPWGGRGDGERQGSESDGDGDGDGDHDDRDDLGRQKREMSTSSERSGRSSDLDGRLTRSLVPPTRSNAATTAQALALTAIDRPPPEEYKKLSSKEKRQIRNKISARNFRVRRKEYITQMEEMVAVRDEKIKWLEGQVEKHKIKSRELENLVASLNLINLNSTATTHAETAPAPSSPISARTNLPTMRSRKDIDPRALTRATPASTRRAFAAAANPSGSIGVHTVFLPNYDHLTSRLAKDSDSRRAWADDDLYAEDVGSGKPTRRLALELIKAPITLKSTTRAGRDEVLASSPSSAFDTALAAQVAPVVLSALLGLFAQHAFESASAADERVAASCASIANGWQQPWEVMASQVCAVGE